MAHSEFLCWLHYSRNFLHVYGCELNFIAQLSSAAKLDDMVFIFLF